MSDYPSMTNGLKADDATRAEALARQIMALIDADGAPRTIVAVALGRAVAGFWARFTVDRGHDPEVAAAAVRRHAAGFAELAADLVRAYEKQAGGKPPKPS